MQIKEVIGYQRANLGKKEANELRAEGNVPGVIYGGKDQIHFFVQAYQLRDIVYTPKVYQVDIFVNKVKYSCVLQDIQFHPVNDMILHVDFLLLQDDKEVKIEIPVKLQGTSAGVLKGGRLVEKLKKLKVKALPKNLPDYIPVDITKLEVGKSIKVSEIVPTDFTILNPKSNPVVSVVTTRALKQEEAASGK